jgi:hypothetical protein
MTDTWSLHGAQCIALTELWGTFSLENGENRRYADKSIALSLALPFGRLRSGEVNRQETSAAFASLLLEHGVTARGTEWEDGAILEHH